MTGNRLIRNKISNGYVTEYAWDHRNRLTAITEKDDSNNILATAEYAYDLFNQRIGKTVDADGPGGSAAVLTVFSWESDQINLQFAGADPADLSHRYLWNPAAVDQVLADEAVTSLSSAGAVLWTLADHQGTVRDLAEYDSGLDSTSIANHRVYNAFGELVSETDDAVDHLFAYTGRERDDETGLQYHRARYYDPAVGRWLSEDPIAFAAGDANLNRMVGNNPVSMNDPSGLQGSSSGSGKDDLFVVPGDINAAHEMFFAQINAHLWYLDNFRTLPQRGNKTPILSPFENAMFGLDENGNPYSLESQLEAIESDGLKNTTLLRDILRSQNRPSEKQQFKLTPVGGFTYENPFGLPGTVVGKPRYRNPLSDEGFGITEYHLQWSFQPLSSPQPDNSPSGPSFIPSQFHKFFPKPRNRE